MKITLSVATSRDHYIDDATPQRLTLSTAEDWQEVHALRATHDAILVGGETLRRDNPSLTLKCAGNPPLRVIVSGQGAILRPDGTLPKIFERGESPIIIFSNIEHPEIDHLAEVITAPLIDLPLIVSELERRGVGSLFVEGGAQILRMFLDSKEVNTLRVAVNPTIKVDDPQAPHFDPSPWIASAPRKSEDLGGMAVTTYELTKPHKPRPDDETMMSRAIENSRNSPQRESCYRVGSVVVTANGEIFDGYTLEGSPTHHAEQVAIYKAEAAGADLRGATIYATMEPCSQRSSEPKSCSEIILERHFARAIFALYEPSHFVECHGAENMRRGGVEVLYMNDFAPATREINSHILAPTAEQKDR